MKSELLSQEKNIVTIKVTVDQADFAKQLKKTYSDIARRANIPGFRKGKAPRSVIEMRFGKDAIKSQALEDMLPQLLDGVCSEYDLEPIESPTVDEVSMNDGEDLVFTVKYEVEPEVTLPELENITIDQPVFDVTDSMVEESLNSMKKRFSEYRPAARASQRGDKVRAAYSMTVRGDDGSVILSHEPQIETFDLDAMTLRAEFLEAMTGVAASGHSEADIKIADDYKDAKVAGKTAHYEFDIIEVQEPIEPEINDEFFKKVSKADIHSEEALREEIRTNIADRLKADARTAAENDAIAKITEASTVDVPDSMVRRQKASLRKRYEENIKQRTKMTLEEYYASEGHDLAELEQALEADARRDVLGYLVVDACAKQFGVTVQREDLDAEIAQMADNYGISSDSIKEMLKKRPEDFEGMVSSARYRKTMDAIMAKVKINEVKKGLEADASAAQN